MGRTRLIVYLIALCLVDTVIPVPILGLILIHVIFTQPAWFRTVVADIYGH